MWFEQGLQSTGQILVRGTTADIDAQRPGMTLTRIGDAQHILHTQFVAARKLIRLHFTLHHDEAVFAELVPDTRQYVGKHRRLYAARAIVQRDEGHVSAPSTHGAQVDNQTGHTLRRISRRKVVDAGTETLQFTEIGFDGMPGEVQSQRLLLESQSFGLRQRCNGLAHGERRRCLSHTSEHVGHTDGLVPRGLFRSLHGVVHADGQTRAHRVDVLAIPGEIIHGPGTDQCLHDPFVGPACIHTHTEVTEILEWPALIARLHDGFHRPLTHTPDRTQTVDDTVIEYGETIMTDIYTRRVQRQLHAPHLVNQRDHFVRVLHVCRESGRHEVSTVVSFQPCGLERHQGIGG